MFSLQVANAGGYVLFPGYQRKCGEVGLHDNIGKAVFPVAELEIGKDAFSDIPAEKHIALRKAIFN